MPKLNFTIPKLDPRKLKPKDLLIGAALFNPVGAVVGLGLLTATEHPSAVKNTIGDIGKGIEKAAPVVFSTIGKGLKEVKGTIGGAWNKLLLPLMIVGAIVLIVVVKK